MPNALDKLIALRNAIHSCNRPGLREGKRLEWRDAVDEIVREIEDSNLDNTPSAALANAQAMITALDSENAALRRKVQEMDGLLRTALQAAQP
jgi:hypothetical protein